ncbi:LysR family transcriptional regulator [Maricaulis parjimensis]|uniref:LysR family transcriptional regulator n=1 Tax=Maricaulis parjimensis TaxID=144023 RepID=UPI00193A8390|nr:LysR family transcriptional regulator [Maricaulis parjimensis]
MEPWDLNIRHLRAFGRTCELGTVAAAAAAINLSQPAVTQAINRLENQLDEVLFERQSTGMRPTPAADLIYPRVAAALERLQSPHLTNARARAFIALASAGGYGPAAALLGVSKASLHRAVSDLELSLGHSLVARRGRGLEITRRGRLLARSLRLAQIEIEAALIDLAARRGLSRGKIRVGSMPLSRARILPDAAVAFHARDPDVEISITDGSHAELIEPLRDGDLDMLLGALREPEPGPDVTQLPLFEDRPVVMARSTHPVFHTSRTISVADLSPYPWAAPGLGVPLREQLERYFQEASLPPPRVPVECGSVITIRNMLLSTDYLSLLSPDQVSVELETNRLRVVCSGPDWMSRTIGLTHRKDWRPTALESRFIDTLKQVAPGRWKTR